MSIRPCKAYTDRTKSKCDTSKGTSCPSAIGHALKELQEKINARCFADEEIEEEYYDDYEKEFVVTNSKGTHKLVNNLICPECESELHFEGGCILCSNCGWTKCD